MKVWEIEGTDIVRFVLSRDEWHLLIEAIAGVTAWSRPEQREKMWKALDVLKTAEVDIDASAMVIALNKIIDFAKGIRKPDDNDITIIKQMASSGLPAKQ